MLLLLPPSETKRDGGDGVLNVAGDLLAGGDRVPVELDVKLSERDGALEVTATSPADHRRLGITWIPSPLTGATELIVTRQLGISRRMFSTPTSMAAIILGEGAGRLALALFEGAFIVLASALLFNVNWADPAATTAIVVVFAFVSAGAALLIGTLVRNASQAGAIAPAIGLIVALLGGTMVPPEVFPEMFELARTLLDGSLVVEPDAASDAVRLLASRAHVVAEGAGAVPVAAATAGLAGRGRVVAIGSGGSIDASRLATILTGTG